jgi:hypothetical protein
MAENASVIESVLNQSDSVLILFFMLIIIALVPFYKVFSKERKERIEQEHKRQEKYIEQNNLMIKALNEVTSAVIKLDTLIELTAKDSKASTERIHNRIYQMLILLNQIYYKIHGSEQNMPE